MGKSNARKQREKVVREGKRDPALNRGIYAMANLSTRRTKTKKEALQQQYKKTHRFHNESDESFFYTVRFMSRLTTSNLPVSGLMTRPCTHTSGGKSG